MPGRTLTITALLLVALGGAGEAQEQARCREVPPPGRGPAPVPEGGASRHEPASSHALAVFYAVPSDVEPDPAVLERIKEATRDIQAWYQCAAGGLVWEIVFPETVMTYEAAEPRAYYAEDWWGRLLGEMGGNGLPIWSAGTIAAIWAHGAGWWAGGAQWCGTDCGVALLGVDLFPEFNDPAYSGGTCPGGSGGAAWPCTPEGAFAHEVGHTLGLPHPVDNPETEPVAGHSIMQTHWNYPDYAGGTEAPWGFLTAERAVLLANPFMQEGIGLVQNHDCEIVNLPVTGTAPVADFSISVSGATVYTTNRSTGAAVSYWTFGDGDVSNETSPQHTYDEPGAREITLRVLAANGMMDREDQVAVPVGVGRGDERRPPGVRPLTVSPNPVRGRTSVQLTLPEAAPVTLAVYSIAGRLVRVLFDGFLQAGPHAFAWQGDDERGREVGSGIYLVTSRTPASVERVKVVLVGER